MLGRVRFSSEAPQQERARLGPQGPPVHAELAEGLPVAAVALGDPEGEHGQVRGNGQPVGRAAQASPTTAAGLLDRTALHPSMRPPAPTISAPASAASGT